MADIGLSGCRSRPLIGYLKALGLLRIVVTQGDPSARGRWQDDAFELRTELTAKELTTFFIDRYAPSPVVSPWNGGSGFHPKDRQEAMLALEQATEPRFAAYQQTIRVAREALSDLGLSEKPTPDVKLPLVRRMRRSVPDEALPWLDAAIVVTGEKVSYPPLLGSGGNDGRYDFSNNYAHAVVQCLLSNAADDSLSLLSAALWGTPATLQRKLSLGHLSRDASPNNSPYGEADSLGNPWDLILAVEGTLLLAAGAARRHGAAIGGTLVAPFTVHSTAAGYGSAVSGESGRAEMWLPIWPQWATCSEITMLARESRAEVGRGGSQRLARTGLDFARAAGELGVARGIVAFERYAILERAGQSSLAVPAGRVSVSERPGAAVIQSIDRWLTNVLQFGKSDACSRETGAAVRRLEQSAFALASRGKPEDACGTLEAIGAVEHALACSRAAAQDSRARPLARVSAAPWIEAANDGTPEFALAASIASLRDRDRRSPAMRDYLHGTRDGGSTFDPERRDMVRAGNPMALLAAIHARRHLDAARSSTADQSSSVTSAGQPAPSEEKTSSSHRLEFDHAIRCNPGVARLLAAGEIDEQRVLRLLHGLALLDYRGQSSSLAAPSYNSFAVTPAFDLLALVWNGHRLRILPREAAAMLGPRPGWATRLAAGSVAPVLADASLRLRMSRRQPIFTPRDLLAPMAQRSQLGSRLAAALLPQLSATDVQQIAERITIDMETDPKHEQRKEPA